MSKDGNGKVNASSCALSAPLFNVAPPDQFNFSNPASWPQWRKRFERYMTVSGLSSKSDDEKMNALYIMGEKSEEIIIQFPAIPATYEEMLKAFEDHFIPRRNVIFERFQMNSRVQLPGESVENFITALHTLAEHCEYGSLKEEMIRDRIVVGMSDKKASERMQLQSSLKLSDATLMAKQAELQSKQNDILRQESVQVNAMGKNKANKFGNQRFDKHQYTAFDVSCDYCGLKQHSRDTCPARDATCRACKKRGHWERVCKAKDQIKGRRHVKVIESESSEVQGEDSKISEAQFIGNITSTDKNIRVNKSYAIGNVFTNEKKPVDGKFELTWKKCSIFNRHWC